MSTSSPGPAGSPDELAAQVEALRVENERLSETYQNKKRARRSRGLRWVAATLIFIVAALLAPVAVSGVWIKAQVLDTDRYVATVAPLAENPGVQQAIATELSDKLFEKIDIQKVVTQGFSALTTRGIPEQINLLIPAISNGIKSLISSTILRLVQTEQFKQAWVTANEQAHTALVNALTGDTGAVKTDAKTKSVSIDMAAFLAAVKPQLISAGIPFADNLPSINASFVIFEGANVGKAQEYASLLSKVGAWLPWVEILLLVFGVWVSPNRRRGFIGAGISLFAGMAMLAVALATARGWYVANLPGGIFDATTAGQVFDQVVSQIRTVIRAGMALSLVVIVAAIVTGPNRVGQSVRSGLKSFSRVTRKVMSRDTAPPTDVEKFAKQYKTAISWAIAVIAFLILMLTTQPSLGFILWLVIIAVILIVIVEVVGTPNEEPPEQPAHVEIRETTPV